MDEQIEAFIEYLATHKHYAANTLMAYRNDLMQFYQFVINERPHLGSWARVDSLLLQAHVLQMRARYSTATVARKVAALKSFYFFLVDERVLASNPTLQLDPPRVTKHPPHVLDEDQVNALLAAPTDPSPKGMRDRAMLELMYATGIRVTELVGLTINAVDWQENALRVGSDARERRLPLSLRAQARLRDYVEKGRSTYRLPPGNGPLFANPRGKPLTRQGVWLIIKQYVMQTGIEVPVTPHALRHSFAAHRLAHGEQLKDLQRMLGHAHLSTTQVYSRTPELAREENA